MIQEEEGEAMAFTLTSLAFKEGDLIPKKHTCEGPDLSPPLRWISAPKGTKSFALIADESIGCGGIECCLEWMRNV